MPDDRLTPGSAARERRRSLYPPLKRAMDVAGALVLLVLTAPIMLGIAVLVRLTLGAPVLFSQLRPGRNERVFRLHKFRTMREARDADGRPLSDEGRMTRVGHWLRRSSLDELPELFSVLKGDMSLVGPRPLLVEYLDRYDGRQRRRHEVRPGVTGLAQVSGRNALPWEERLELDVRYVERMSPWLDLKILLKTIPYVVLGRGVRQEGRATVERFGGTRDGEGRAR